MQTAEAGIITCVSHAEIMVIVKMTRCCTTVSIPV